MLTDEKNDRVDQQREDVVQQAKGLIHSLRQPRAIEANTRQSTSKIAQQRYQREVEVDERGRENDGEHAAAHAVEHDVDADLKARSYSCE